MKHSAQRFQNSSWEYEMDGAVEGAVNQKPEIASAKDYSATKQSL